MSITSVLSVPQLAVPTADDAIFIVNRWLSREVGMAVHAISADFDAATFYWHLPIELAYAPTGTLGLVGDIYLHAATGSFAGKLDPKELICRAETIAESHGIE
jgi:hypothetical protein